jgi:hypothetical protein
MGFSKDDLPLDAYFATPTSQSARRFRETLIVRFAGMRQEQETPRRCRRGAGGEVVSGHKDVPPGTPATAVDRSASRGRTSPARTRCRRASRPASACRAWAARRVIHLPPHLFKEMSMQLFKTEMLFLHPPRTRPAYGFRPLRYGRRLPMHSPHADLPRLSDAVLRGPAEEVDAVLAVVVDRAA